MTTTNLCDECVQAMTLTVDPSALSIAPILFPGTEDTCAAVRHVEPVPASVSVFLSPALLCRSDVRTVVFVAPPSPEPTLDLLTEDDAAVAAVDTNGQELSSGETKTFYLCGDHAGEVLKSGGVLSPTATLSLGQKCNFCQILHGSSLQATNAVDVDAAVYDATIATLNAPATDEPPATVPATMGPLTELSARFLVAWTQEEKGANADGLAVGRAIDVARQLLVQTGGR